MKTARIISASVCVACMISCSGSMLNPEQEKQEKIDCRIAVILPLSNEEGPIWKNTVEWALENIDNAQRGLSCKVVPHLEWYDELSMDMDALARELRTRDDIDCVIGPCFSDDVKIVAAHMATTGKTIISPFATSMDVIREYTLKGNFWSLVEPDIVQCECFISMLMSYGYTELAMISSTSSYGKTFLEWMPYFAKEMGLKLTEISSYDDDPANEGLRRIIREKVAGKPDGKRGVLLCTPSDTDGVCAVLDECATVGCRYDYLAFPGVAFSPAVSKIGKKADFIQGICPSADPSSGFRQAYKIHFGFEPICMEAHVYDAVMMAALGMAEKHKSAREHLSLAFKEVCRTSNAEGGKRKALNVFLIDGLIKEFEAIDKGEEPYDISGATGSLDFVNDTQTTVVTNTIYNQWVCYKGNFHTVNYSSRAGSSNVESATAAWEYTTSVLEEIYDIQPLPYPDRTDNWALLVAGSEGWTDLRHQSDVMALYKRLKKNGFDDRHIILVMEDDLRDNPNNPNPGYFYYYNGEELRDGVEPDYKLSELQADDFEKILTGRKDSRLKEVIDGNQGSNILIFWCGHGEPCSYLMGKRDAEEGFTKERMESLLRKAAELKCYRKMLWFCGACYSESVAMAALDLGTPGMMAITAADAQETSKADIHMDGAWRTNYFSESLLKIIDGSPDITLSELYRTMTGETLGSHVCLVNENNFDNLYLSGLLEFIRPL